MASFQAFVLCILVQYAVSGTEDLEETVELQTKFGKVTGLVWKSLPNEKSFYAFQSIPYAEPPIGSRRFQSPETLAKVVNANTVIDGTKASPICPQWSFRNAEGLSQEPLTGNEDCLYLNVFVTKAVVDNRTGSDERDGKKVPVMVWIHGGAFLGGSGSPLLYGPHYFMDYEDVIIVTLNYRVGALGWLSLNDDVISGNMGHRDQVMALQWIQENIEEFGGDPARVVLFGESAGGISVMWHLLSPLSKGLFHKVISQSGPVVDSAPLYLSQPASVYGYRFASALGCNKSEELDSKAVLKCLQTKSLEDIMDASRMFEEFTFMPNPWKPVVDPHSSNPILKEDPWKVLQSGRYNQVPIILGGNRDEGCIYMMQLLMNPHKFEKINADLDKYAPLLFLGTDGEANTNYEIKMAKSLLKHYTKTGKFEKKSWHRIENLFSDAMFLSSIDQAATYFLRTSNQLVFYYNFRYRSDTSLPMLYSYDKSQGDLGVCHADDLFVTFHQAGLPKSRRDEAMTLKMTRLWTDFARQNLPDIEWKRLIRGSNPKFAILDEGHVRMASNHELSTFWERISFINERLERLRNQRLNHANKGKRHRIKDEL